MKKGLLLLLSGLMFLHTCVYAGVVSPQSAQTIAANFFNVTANTSYPSTASSLAYTRLGSNNLVDFYVFNIHPKGFVIVSADDALNPVIAYSIEANFDPQAAGIQNWMNNAAEKIHQGILQQV